MQLASPSLSARDRRFGRKETAVGPARLDRPSTAERRIADPDLGQLVDRLPVGFTSSRAALTAFRSDPQRFDAVITDERMPGMSGSALIREVRGIRERIPVVLMSGYVGDAAARQARDAGVEEVLRKPLSARDLATSLARVLHA